MKIRICDRFLLLATVLILASGVQLEITSGSDSLWVWAHIIGGTIFFGLIAWHLCLHFGNHIHPQKKWYRKRNDNRWLAITAILTLLSGIIATVHWAVQPEHSKIGAVHGKIGFLFTGFAIWHIARRARFYLRQAGF